jgi:hypothetical protein
VALLLVGGSECVTEASTILYQTTIKRSILYKFIYTRLLSSKKYISKTLKLKFLSNNYRRLKHTKLLSDLYKLDPLLELPKPLDNKLSLELICFYFKSSSLSKSKGI